MTNDFSIPIISTGDKGFNFILDEEYHGIRNSPDQPTSILLKGGPGCGKSTCALQLAKSYVRTYKTICVYYALEESPRTVQKRLQAFFGDESPKSILAEDLNDSSQRREFVVTAQKEGGIIFSRFEFKRHAQLSLIKDNPWLPFGVTMAKLPEQLDNVKQLIPGLVSPLMVVVDSFNALIKLSETLSSEVPRQLLIHLLRIIGDKNFCSVFVFEEDKNSKNSITIEEEEYIVEAVIEFGIYEDAKGQRFVRVRKIRDHKCSPAIHLMEIRNGVGIQVYPNTRSAFQILNEEIKPSGPPKCFGIHGLDNDLATSHGSLGLKPGSATILVGEPENINLLLGLSFLKNGLPDEKIMLMCIGGKDFPIDRIGDLVLSSNLKKAYKEEYSLLDIRYISSSKFVYDVSEKIYRKKEFEGNINRLLIADLRMLFEYYRKEFDEIIAYLLKLFSSEGITSVFVYTASNVNTKLDSNIFDRFENIIETKFFEEEISEHRYLSVRVKKYDGISVNRPLRELVYNFDSAPIQTTAEPGIFRYKIETKPGEVGFGKLIVRHYSDETSELNEVWDYIKSSMTELFPLEVKAKNLEFTSFTYVPVEADAVLESVAIWPMQGRHPISEILMFDEFWAEWLIRKKRLIPINKIDPEFQLNRYLDKEKYPAMLSPVLEGDILYGIPMYGNCSLLVYNKSVLKEYWDRFPEDIRKVINAKGSINKELRWDHIFDIISVIKKQELVDNKKTKLVGIYFDEFAEESVSGLFLELLWGMLMINEKQREISTEHFLSKSVLKVLQWWNNRYVSCCRIDPENMVHQGTAQIENIPTFIFGHMWYTRFASFKSKNPQLDLGVTKIPCLGNSPESSVSLSGNWYLGVLAGSLNEKWAAKIAKWITSYKVNYRIARKSIALPAYRTFWENRFVDPEIADIYCTVKQRSVIPDYVHIRSALTDVCRKVIQSDQIRQYREIESILKRLTDELHTLHEQRQYGLT